MLRVWGISGEEVAAIALEDFRNVRSLKKHLQRRCGVPRFRQRLTQDGRVLHDVEALRPNVDLQLILLAFPSTSQEDANKLVQAGS